MPLIPTRPIRNFRSPLLRAIALRAGALGLMLGIALCPTLHADDPPPPERKILLVIGTPGAETFAKDFAETVALWKKAADEGGVALSVIGLDPPSDDTSDADRLRDTLRAETAAELWLVLIGHGTYDHRDVKFNLRGPDITDKDLAQWLDAYSGELVVINGASASGSFIRRLSRANRVIITATKNEAEQSYARFGKYFAEAMAGADAADIDQDQQVSLLEAFLYASVQVDDFYEGENRIATEHALLDDNGDRLGSRSEWFQGITPVQTPAKGAAPDGDLAAQKALIPSQFERQLPPNLRRQRDHLERQVITLRRGKDTMNEGEYYKKLEALLRELAEIYAGVGDHRRDGKTRKEFPAPPQ